MQNIESTYDVAVVGAGPVGMMAAIAHADRGDNVLILEANPNASRRFAGEWLHPPSVGLLRDYGIIGHKAFVENEDVFSLTKGFVVFPDDGGEPIPIPYESGQLGCAVEHFALVDSLRKASAGFSSLQYSPGCRARASVNGQLQVTGPNRESYDVKVKRVIGADGRSSSTRKALGYTGTGKQVSSMGGVELTDVQLPFEGYGHVFVGPPGPVMVYRIGANSVRVTIDVPARATAIRDDVQALSAAITKWMPADLGRALHEKLLAKRVTWMGTRFRPRTDYGVGSVALVGDAVGHFHPLSASGMTMGFLDVQCLLKNEEVASYQKQRSAQSYVPELLSTALYELFTSQDDTTKAMRHAVYRSWRRNPRQREQLTNMLAVTDTNKLSFSRVVTEIGLSAAISVAGQSIRSPALRQLIGNVRGFVGWGRWPIAGLMPMAHKGFMRQSNWPQKSKASVSRKSA